MQYELIIFDLDDTLIDNLENVRYAYKKMIEYMGQEYSEQDFEKWILFDKKFWIDFYEGKFSVPYEKNDSKFVPYVQSLRYYLFFDKKITMDKALEINDLFLSSLKEVVVAVEGAYETLEALLMADCNPKDVVTDDDCVVVTTEPDDFEACRDALLAANPDLEFIENKVTFVPMTYAELDAEHKEKFERLIATLEGLDDVDAVYHNAKL